MREDDSAGEWDVNTELSNQGESSVQPRVSYKSMEMQELLTLSLSLASHRNV